MIKLIILVLLCLILIYKLKNNRNSENFESLKKDVIIYSPGGVGCTVLFKFIKDKNKSIIINDIHDSDKIKHNKTPINNITKKAIYIMNDPLLAVLSHYRRKWADIQMEKMGNFKYKNYTKEELFNETLKQNKDIFGIENQFDNFINSNVNYQILFVYFKNIHKNKKKICDFLNIHPKTFDDFKIKKRKSDDKDVDKNVKKIYNKLNKRFLEYDMFIKHNKIFLTYGDLKFKKSRERIVNEANQLNYFNNIIMETEKTILDDEFQKALKNKKFRNVFNNKRGGGYWLWKPYIIYKNLKLINDNDILIYSDAGSTIYNNKNTYNKLNKYINIINKSSKGILGFKNEQIESKWTKGDIFKHFNCLNNKDIYNTTQFSGGSLHIVRKCKYSLYIYKLWWDTARKFPELFDDKTNKIINYKNFIENRHDQSVWSLICKTNNIEYLSKNDIPIKATRIRL